MSETKNQSLLSSELAIERMESFNVKMAQFDSVTKNLCEFQRAVEIPRSISKFMRDIEVLTAPTRAFKNILDSGSLEVLKSVPEITSSNAFFINRMLKPQKAMLDELGKLSQLNPIISQLSSTTSGVLLSKLLTDNLDRLFPKLGALSYQYLEKISELTVEFHSELPNITISDIDELALALESVNTKAETNHEFWNEILNLKPYFQWIFFYIVLPMLVNYGYDLLKTDVSLPGLPIPAAQTKAKVISKAKIDLCTEHLRLCKFVTATELNVRSEGTKKSSVIDRLQFGQGVFVVEKDDSRNWSYVEYYEYETQEYRVGWVYSRYLKRYIK
jgi:hypothetical protein